MWIQKKAYFWSWTILVEAGGNSLSKLPRLASRWSKKNPELHFSELLMDDSECTSVVIFRGSETSQNLTKIFRNPLNFKTLFFIFSALPHIYIPLAK